MQLSSKCNEITETQWTVLDAHALCMLVWHWYVYYWLKCCAIADASDCISFNSLAYSATFHLDAASVELLSCAGFARIQTFTWAVCASICILCTIIILYFVSRVTASWKRSRCTSRNWYESWLVCKRWKTRTATSTTWGIRLAAVSVSDAHKHNIRPI